MNNKVEIIIIEKEGNIMSETVVNDIKNIKDLLFKKSGFRKNDDFKCIDKIKINNEEILFYGKNKGKNNLLNKWNSKNIINNEKFYGKIIIVKIINNNLISLTIDDFNKIINNQNNNLKKDNKNDELNEVYENEDDEDEDEDNEDDEDDEDDDEDNEDDDENEDDEDEDEDNEDDEDEDDEDDDEDENYYEDNEDFNNTIFKNKNKKEQKNKKKEKIKKQEKNKNIINFKITEELVEEDYI